MYIFKQFKVRMGENQRQGLITGNIYKVYGANPNREQFLVIDEAGHFVFVDFHNTTFAGDDIEVTIETNNCCKSVDEPGLIEPADEPGFIEPGDEPGEDTGLIEPGTTEGSPEIGSDEAIAPKTTGRFGRPIQPKGK